MLKSYHRRAFLVCAFLAAEPGLVAPSHASDTEPPALPPTLWEVLSHVDRDTAHNPTSIIAVDQPLRRPIGPVPGFTLPVSRRTAAPGETLFTQANRGKKKKKRPLFGPVGAWFDRMQASTGTKIKMSGHHTTSFRMEHISGGSDATSSYHDSYNYGQGSGGIYNDSDLTVDATLFKYFHYQTRLSNNPFRNVNDNKVKLEYGSQSSRNHFEYGDLNASFTGNSLVDFNRYLSGMQMSNQWTKQLKTTVLFSHTKAETHTITIPGGDKTGPYYTFAGQVVEGSDHVRVDNRDMVKGKDYTLDNFTGELNFLNGNVILHTSSIAISFETQGYSQNEGTIYGFRTDLTPRGSSRFGLTYVTQQSKGSGGSSLRKEKIQGLNQPDGLYSLSAPADLTKPVIVTVDGTPLVVNTDYTISSQLPDHIQIKAFLTPDRTIEVAYFPVNSSITPGNRSIMGLDATTSLGKWGTLNLEGAQSGLSLSGNNVGGNAFQVRADLNPLRGVHTNLTLRDISPSFSSIQSPGFSRQEKAAEMTTEWSPLSTLHFSVNWQKSKRPSYAGTTGQFTTTSTGNDTYDQYGLTASYNFARNGTINLSRTSLGTRYLAGGQTTSLNDTLGLNYTLRSVSIEASLNRSNNDNTGLNSFGYDPITGTALTGNNYNSHNQTFSKRLGLGWHALRWLSFTGTLSDNDITSLDATSPTHTTARDTSFGAQLTPAKNLRLNYTYSLSDTGNSSGLTNTGTTGTIGTTGTAALATGTGTTVTDTTGTGSTTTTSAGLTTTGVATGRSFFRPYTIQFPPLRDLTPTTNTTGTTTGTTTGSTNAYSNLSSLGYTGGGGVNSSLGSSGNYSSYYNNNSYYSGASYGGRSQGHRMDINFTPRHDMQVGLNLATSSSIGDYLYNSNRRNAGLNFAWQPNDRFQMNLAYTIQKVSYTNSAGGSNSTSRVLSINARPFGRMNAQLSWLSVINSSQSLLNQISTTTAAVTGTGATGSSLTDTSTTQDSLSLHLDYPLSPRYSLFVDWLSSLSGGYLGSTQDEMKFGVDIGLLNNLKFSLGWQTQSHLNKDSSLANYNYKSSSILAELGLHF